MAALLQKRRTGEPPSSTATRSGSRAAALTATRVLEQDAAAGEGRPPRAVASPTNSC
jgi:hypothetical protein